MRNVLQYQKTAFLVELELEINHPVLGYCMVMLTLSRLGGQLADLIEDFPQNL